MTDPALPVERIDYLGEMLIKVEAELAAREKIYEAGIKELKEIRASIQGRILAFFSATGQSSAKTRVGTIVSRDRDTAALGDADAFMRYVLDRQAFHLMDRRANVTAVRDYIKEHKIPPPGVNFSTRTSVYVLRSK